MPGEVTDPLPAGIGVLPPSNRVRITDWATSGMVSSRPTIAATAVNEETPGMISTARSRARHRSSCSCTAPQSAGSPEWIRATVSRSAAARR